MSPECANKLAQESWTLLHISLTVVSAKTLKEDNARESKSDKSFILSVLHSATNVVQLWRKVSSFLFWAIFICANASSRKSFHTTSDKS